MDNMIPKWLSDLGIFALIIGFVGRLVWAYIQESRKRRSPGDQIIVQSELKNWCDEKRANLSKKILNELEHAKKEWETDMNHVAETIKGHLKRGEKRFDRVEAVLTKHEETSQAQILAFELLKQEIQKSNGKQSTGPDPNSG